MSSSDSPVFIEAPRRERLTGIDAMRALALLGIVYLHVPKIGETGWLIDQALRFCVPFFFASSGYLIAQRGLPGRQALGRLFWRVAVPFVVWFLIYNLIKEVWLIRHNPGQLFNLQHLVELSRGGEGFHLWFLPSLVLCSGLLLMLRRYPPALMIGVALGLYAVGVVFGAYCRELFGFRLFWNTRDGPFFGLIFMVTGYLIAKRGLVLPLRTSLAIFACGLLLQLTEFELFKYPDYLIRTDYIVSTLPFGIGGFLVSLHLGRLPGADLAARIGRYGLGIYCIHVLVLHNLIHEVGGDTLRQVGALTVLTFAVSTLLVLGAARARILRPFLS